MNTTLRSAALGAVLLHSTSRLSLALRSMGPEAAWSAFEERHPSIPIPLWERWQRCEADAMLERGTRSGARLVVPGDPDWPSALDDLGPTSPWAIWVRGSLTGWSGSRCVSIVGSRSATAYGERTAAAMAHDLVEQGLPVVSGGAYGIDAAAHRGALAAGAATIAVLASGVDVPYPLAHSTLFDCIASTGCLLSEAPPGATPTRQGFLHRNRLIAALGYGTVVVEARTRSGALSTFAHARVLHRVLMAVPGPVDAPESAGTNALLQGEAQLVTGAEDVIDLVAPLRVREPAPTPGREWDELTPEERLVHDALPARAPLTIDGLLGRVARPMAIGELLAALTRLAQRGLVSEAADGEWRRSRALRGAAA